MQRKEIIRNIRNFLFKLGEIPSVPEYNLFIETTDLNESEARARGGLISLANHIDAIRAGTCRESLAELMDLDGFRYDPEKFSSGINFRVKGQPSWQIPVSKALDLFTELESFGFEQTKDKRLGKSEVEYFASAPKVSLQMPAMYPQYTDFLRILAAYHGYPGEILDGPPLPGFSPMVINNPLAPTPVHPASLPTTPIGKIIPIALMPEKSPELKSITDIPPPPKEPPAQPKIQKRQKPSQEEQLEAQRVALEERVARLAQEKAVKRGRSAEEAGKRKAAEEEAARERAERLAKRKTEPAAAMETQKTDIGEEQEKIKKHNLRKYDLNGLLHDLENPYSESGDSLIRYNQFAAAISELAQKLDTHENQTHAKLADILFSESNIKNALKSEKLYPSKTPQKTPSPRNLKADGKFLSSDETQAVLDQLQEELSTDAIQGTGVLLRSALGQEKASPFSYRGR